MASVSDVHMSRAPPPAPALSTAQSEASITARSACLSAGVFVWVVLCVLASGSRCPPVRSHNSADLQLLVNKRVPSCTCDCALFFMCSLLSIPPSFL